MSYTFDQVTEFRIKEKIFSLSGDSFSIKRESDGEQLFKVKGNAFSIRDSKKLLTADGTELYKMTEKLLSFRDRMYIEDVSSGEKVLTVRKKSIISVPIIGGRTLQVWKGGDDDGEPWLEIKGSVLRKNFKVSVVDGEQEAAVVSRKLFNLSTLLDSDSYVVRINPGFDAALMLFLAIAVDEHYHDD